MSLLILIRLGTKELAYSLFSIETINTKKVSRYAHAWLCLSLRSSWL